MRKILAPILSAFISLITSGQRSIDGLIQVENAFAAHAVTHGTKDAFLKFVDSSGIVFNEGKPVNGIEFWNKKANDPGILNWHPRYAAIARSGDLGFTTGPWTFQTTLQDSAIARGIYTTVWRITKTGEWKFLIDLGVSKSPAIKDSVPIVLRTTTHAKKKSLSSLQESEKNFIALSNDPSKAYNRYLSSEAILNRNGELPHDGAWSPNLVPEHIEYKVLGSGIASSGDLGYVYGTTVINNKTDNYLRIWKQEQGEWHIVVEVLRY
jgi:ketosteroid isomerase-like protein